ncbi:hypothetical protein DFQ26_005610 [Actinomortierella ambigua]|nr:hypothetical protein DFQ26_005610 [Actinomortierella ambigua]
MLSMIQAVKDGADGLEADRTTNGTGYIKDRPWHGYIDGLTSKKEPHVGVPRCSDVLAFLAQEGNEKVWWNVDIKMNNSPTLLAKFAELIKDKFPHHDFSNQIVLGIWHPKFLPAADLFLPKFSRILIGFSVSIAREHFPPAVVDGYSMNFMVLCTPEGRAFIKEMQAAGKPVLIWTVNDTAEAREAVEMGVDYILTDRTKVFHKVLHEYEALGREEVRRKHQHERFDTWGRFFRYSLWRTLIWAFLTMKFNQATKQTE